MIAASIPYDATDPRPTFGRIIILAGVVAATALIVID
jgi:hypothetical protein